LNDKKEFFFAALESFFCPSSRGLTFCLSVLVSPIIDCRSFAIVVGAVDEINDSADRGKKPAREGDSTLLSRASKRN
jgi:hypothetical protein